MKDYYEILNVSRSASDIEIKKSYRRLVLLYHPDKNPDPSAYDLIKEINEAYDILSDTQKKQAYDVRLQNPLAEILQNSSPPRHRDPAYKRKSTNHSRSKPEPPQSYILMRDYLKYFMWCGRAGLVVTILFFVDYVLPYNITEENISDIQAVRFRRGTAYHKLTTETGRVIKMYNDDYVNFVNETRIRLKSTLIYSTMMTAETTSGSSAVNLAYIYRSLLFMPLTLFICSLLALLFKKRIEFSFNLNIVSGILLIITLVLL